MRVARIGWLNLQPSARPVELAERRVRQLGVVATAYRVGKGAHHRSFRKLKRAFAHRAR
jgi:hypothetical protein